VRTLAMFIVPALLAGCGSGADAPAAPTGGETARTRAAADTRDGTTDGGAGAACGSLAPLLRLLPVAKTVDGLPERYRTCEAGEYSVTVGYHDDGDYPSEYRFRVQLLRGDSVYAEQAVNPAGATDEQRAFLREAITRIGDLYQTRFNLCRNYADHPTIPDGRNPARAIIKGVDVCFSDNLDANREIWRATAAQNNLGFELELTGAKAAAISTTLEAQKRLAPLFGDFLLDEAAQ
jgi:hypothetical protein